MNKGIIICCLCFSCLITAGSYARQAQSERYNIGIKAGTLDEALRQLAGATGLNLTYNPLELRQVRVKAYAARQKSIQHILDNLLRGSGFTFRVNGSRVLIYKPREQNVTAAHAPLAEKAAEPQVLTGKVLDEKDQPLEFASVKVRETGSLLTTSNEGTFRLQVPPHITVARITVTYVGKRTEERLVEQKEYGQMQLFRLQDLSLSLEGVQVTGVQKAQQSNSSVVFDRESIEQSQAFSMADILNNLPGKEIKAPNLHEVQTLTLRTSANAGAAMNNSLGTAFIIDDILLSNNANMQTKSIGKYGGSLISQAGYGSFDVPFTGLDLRDIPVNNIERIEVISGVAPAQYGDITNGAVIIDRQAGKNKLQLGIGISGYSSQYSLSKGLALGRKWGALNLSANYLRSNENPVTNLQTYARTNLGLMWTDHFGENIKNTISVDYSFRNDDIKVDPEDIREKKTFIRSRNIRISNRTAFTIQHDYLKRISLSMGYSKGHQESYTQYAFNSDPRPMADKDTTGIYEGYYTPGIFTSIDHILGEPENFNGNLVFSGEASTGKVLHQLSAGANLYISNNGGKGVVVNPEAPRFANLNYQNERPYSFDLMPAIINSGYFLQDNFELMVSGRTLTTNAGLRYDVQNGQGTLQPRLNMAYSLNKTWQVTFGYGLATKAPTMAYRYPSPIYFDLPVLQVYDADPAKRVFLVYTEKLLPDNSALKPMRASQLEGGLKYKDARISSSLFLYYKRNRDGFTTADQFQTFRLPVYDYKIENNKLVYWQTDSVTTKLSAAMKYNKVTNGTSSNDIGVEWFISTKKIRSIQTSFSLVSSFSFSDFSNSNQRLKFAEADLQTLYNVMFGVYPATSYKYWSLTSKLNTTTHIPKLGFIVNISADMFITRQRKSLGSSQMPLGYADLQSNYYVFGPHADTDPIYTALGLYDAKDSEGSDPFYMNFHLQVAKEIRKKIRFSVRAYNVFNLRNRVLNRVTGDVRTLREPVSVSGEISFKF
ncbi:TonB-dependent receptor domain-containing protein [Chitinophaga sp. XS-30]|uniref:TonB-dependent receptor n=1 Tax=Chitinophaga sp. XS-30 TaxID=2604421 RepID=UPI0011DD2229|nr:TonB-dependent receptor [Chitinophaga sp. XS-30]QEH40853.1 TonB-dependent receptor [Chitinophaga sp. XS-30]